MDADQMVEARRLVAACVRAQASRAGLWQCHGDLRWWQSGLPAMAANLVVDCGQQPRPAQLSALAALLVRASAPAGWLIWPDQQPLVQQPLLRRQGFSPRERLWLASVDGHHFEPDPAPSSSMLTSADSEALARLYQACHHIPIHFAAVTAQAFLESSPQLRTFAQLDPGSDGLPPRPVASITACLMSPPGLQQSVPLGGLVWLGTHPAWRRRGYARQLTLQACRWLAAAGVERIHVQAASAAVSLYQSLGFVEQGWLDLWGCER